VTIGALVIGKRLAAIGLVGNDRGGAASPPVSPNVVASTLMTQKPRVTSGTLLSVPAGSIVMWKSLSSREWEIGPIRGTEPIPIFVQINRIH
jgi:hypothetical protein